MSNVDTKVHGESMNSLSALLAQQSSPVEVLVFLAVVVAVFLGIAFLVYALIMTFMRFGLPTKVPLSRVLFPSPRQLGKHFGDYFLAVATSVLLSLTLMVKHDLVQQIANYEMNTVDAEEIARLFDFGLPADLYGEIEKATLGEVVQPILAAGKIEESSLLVQSIVKSLPQQWLNPKVLIAACAIVTVFYLLWLARRRFKALSQSPQSAPEYASTFRSLLTLALCIGLLLASALPLAQGGEKFLARSALDAIAHEGQSGRNPSKISDQIARELRRQQERASYLYCPNCQEPQQTIWETVRTGAPQSPDLQPIIDELDDARNACQASCSAELERLQAMMEPIQRRLEALNASGNARDGQFTALNEQLGGLTGQVTELQRAIAVLNERRIPALDQRHVRENEELKRRIERLDQQLTRVIQEVAKLGGVTNELGDMQRRVEWLEAQHRDSPPDRQTSRNRECDRYATDAVAKNKLNLENKCGFTGGRWSNNYNGHYEWCLGAPELFRVTETNARNSALKNCSPPVR